jgi:hypothetical protein
MREKRGLHHKELSAHIALADRDIQLHLAPSMRAVSEESSQRQLSGQRGISSRQQII